MKWIINKFGKWIYLLFWQNKLCVFVQIKFGVLLSSRKHWNWKIESFGRAAVHCSLLLYKWWLKCVLLHSETEIIPLNWLASLIFSILNKQRMSLENDNNNVDNNKRGDYLVNKKKSLFTEHGYRRPDLKHENKISLLTKKK